VRVVTLVPWRPEPTGAREELYRVVRPYLDALGWPVFEGDGPGPWSRARAVNAAAELAEDWEAALIADADTIPERMAVLSAVQLAVARGGAIRPHDTLYSLNPVQTRLVARKGLKALNLYVRQRTLPGGGLLAISRAAWDAVDGYDERYVGWGHEDSDLHTRLLARADWDRIPGVAYHLFHPRDRARTTPANRARMDEVQRQHARDIERASRARGYDVGSVL